MPLNENLRQYLTTEGNITDFNSNTDTHVTVDANSYDNSNANQKEFEPSLGDTVILVTPILFVLTTVGVIFYKLKQVKAVTLPCKKCQYYNSNNYLKCAVNPAEVLTEKAKDCRDYTSQPRKFSWSWKGFDKRN